MAAPLKSSNPIKRSVDFTNQKRVTQFFSRSPVTCIPIKVEENIVTISPVPRKRVKKIIIPVSPVKSVNMSPGNKTDVIDVIDSDSSEDNSSFPTSPPKKAKAVKRPLPQITRIPRSFKTENCSQKEVGLPVCNNQQPMTSFNRPALEEKKNVNIKKPKRKHSFTMLNHPDISDIEDQEENRILKEKKFKCENFKSSQEDSDKMSAPVQENYHETNRQHIVDKTLNVSSQKQQQERPKLGNEKYETATQSPSEKTKRTEMPTVTLMNVDKVIDEGSYRSIGKKQASVIVVKTDKREAPNKEVRVVRRSSIRRPEEKDRLLISSKIEVGLEEIGTGAATAFKQTYKDIETLLDMDLGVRVCPNFQLCFKKSRRPLANRFHVNFNFFMNRGDHVGAMDSLPSLTSCQYPHHADLHSIIYEILMKGKNQLALHRGQELIYKILGLHPSCDSVMRKYYWSVLSRNLNDCDPYSRWENLRCLLEKVLEADGENAQKMYANLNSPPSQLECQRAVLGVIVNLLNEDLRCWIQLAKQPSILLRDRIDLPLVARLLWPQSTIPHVNGPCRDLIGFHVAALISGDSYKLSYTEPLVKMMAMVTQLSDLQLPLKVRKPSVRMMELAREILHQSDCLIDRQISFYNSFGSLELSLLLPLTVLNRQKPQISIPEGELLSLTWLLNSYLELDSGGNEEVVSRFWSQPPVERDAFLTALAAYFKLYCAFKTWFHMRDKYRGSSRLETSTIRQRSNQPQPVTMFSRTFSPDHFMADLRQTKYLLGVNQETNTRSLYSLLSWS